MMSVYYSDDHVTLHHGDCREITAWLAADVLITDPPYGIGYCGVEGGGKDGGDNGEWVHVGVDGDDDTAVRDQALAMWGDRPALVFGSWKRPRPSATRAVLIWEKGEHVGMGDTAIPWKPNTEEIYLLGHGFTGRRTTNVLRHNAISPNFTTRLHPMQKPIGLMARLIEKCPPGSIADPFAGSGSTLLAAKLLGRRAIGIEANEEYCEKAAERLSTPDLFTGEAS